jgi:prenyltransferase beta subunit
LKKKILLLAATIFLITIVITCIVISRLGTTQPVEAPDSDSTPVSRALAYLKTQIGDDGSFSGGSIKMTEWVILAIVAGGEDPNEWVGSSGKSTVVWFLSQAQEVYSNLSEEEAKHPVGPWSTYVITAHALGLNPYNIDGYDFVSKIMNQSNADGVLEISPGYLNFNWWGVMALTAAGVPANNSVIQGSIKHIQEYQNSNGGWSYSTVGTPDPDDTAAAIMGLTAAGVPASSPCITKALDYLRSIQDVDGGFKFQNYDTNSASDSWVIISLTCAGEDPTQWTKTEGGNSVVDHLVSLQFYNGSFYWYGTEMNNPVFMTAYAVVALSNETFHGCQLSPT